MPATKKLALVTIFGALVLSAPATASAANRIVGGSATTITANPWQVLVNINLGSQAEFCGGSILDATHVLTAAHCVHRNEDKPFSPLFSPSQFTIAAGTTNVNPFSPAGTIDPTGSLVGVSAIAPDERYDGNDFDEAVLTVSPPLVLDGTYRRAIALATSPPAVGSPVTVSGWGETIAENADSVPSTLQKTTVSVSDFNACNAANMNAFTQATVVCAFTEGQDACSGDSGGPLVDASGTLVGLVSSGPDNCGHGSPGVYASVGDCRVRSFITTQLLGPGPQACSVPSLAGSAAIGQTLTCNNATWSGSPAFTYTFINQADNAVLQTGPTNTYAITDADGNRTVVCRVTATDPTGTQSVTSNAIGPIPMPRDTTAPRAKITSHLCTRTQCIVKVTVSDSGFTTGTPTIRATRHTTTTKRCVVNGRKKTCSHTTVKLLSSRRTSTGFTVTASGLPYGKHRFYITATDHSGNTQSTPTTATSYTHAPER